MNRKVLLVIVTAVLLAAALPVFPAQKVRKAAAASSSLQMSDGTAQPATSGGEPQIALSRRDNRYRLAQDDVLDVEFPFTPSFNQTVTVLPDGYIGLRGIGSLHVEGDTVPELRRSLQRAYSKILHEPVITVTLKDFEKPYFIVGGQVHHPGKFDLRGDTTVIQAVEIAGGFNDNAKHTQILLFRRVSNDWVEVKKLNLKGMLHGKDLSEDVQLMPGDMLFIPKNTVSKIKQFIPSTGMGMYFNPAQY